MGYSTQSLISPKNTAQQNATTKSMTKELLAIIRAFEEWRAHLESAPATVTVLCDHKNLEYFMTTKPLTPRQVRWAEFLSRFNFKIIYRPGKQGGKPDALTRRSGDLPKEGDERLQQRNRILIKPHNLQISATQEGPQNRGPETLENLLDQAYTKDETPNKILEQLRNKEQKSSLITLANCQEKNGHLYYRNCLYIPGYSPLQLRILEDHHSAPAAGHPGRAKTFGLISRTCYWPTLRKDGERFVRNCHICRRSKPNRRQPYGVLRPLSVPQQPWEHISIDFITDLPTSNGFDSILTIVDSLSKQKHLIPCNKTVDSEKTADLILRHVFKLHGLPLYIVSDRGPQFVSRLWKSLCDKLKIQRNLSTAYHPETDGQSEIANAQVEQILRTVVAYLQDDWEDHLHVVKFAMNNQESETTQLSPFFANYGFNPRFHFEPGSTTAKPSSLEYRATETVKILKEVHEFC